MKMTWYLMNKVTIDLAGMTSLSIGDGIINHLWLV